MSRYSPRRQSVPQALVEGAPEWGRVVAETLNRNSEELARGVEVAQQGQPRTKTISVTLPLSQPLTMAEAAGAVALWVGRAETQAGTPVSAPALTWKPSRGGAVVQEIEGEGALRVTLVWI